MWKTFTDISKQNTFDLYLSAFGCPARTSLLLNVFETSFGAFTKNLVVGMLGSFRFNNQFINFLLFLMSRQLTKELRKIVYYYGYRSMRSWPSQLQSFHKMQNTFKIEVLASRFIWKGRYWPKNRSQTKITDKQSKTFRRYQLVLRELKFHQSIKISNCNMAAIIDFCRECLFNKKVPFFLNLPPLEKKLRRPWR